MEEQLISFETAKLAKEKGFYIDCEHGFRINEDGDVEFYECWHLHLSDHYEKHIKETDFLYGCPTQSLLQKWLREVHNIHVVIVGSPLYSPCVMLGGTNYWRQDDELSYEEALEKGLQEALKLITTKN